MRLMALGLKGSAQIAFNETSCCIGGSFLTSDVRPFHSLWTHSDVNLSSGGGNGPNRASDCLTIGAHAFAFAN